MGTPSEVYLNPVNLFVAQFVGSPVMNVMPAEIRAEGGETAVSIGGGPAFAFPGELAPRLGAALPAGHEVLVGVRPEAVRVAHAGGPGLRAVEAQFIEPLGSHDIVDLKVGERFLKARTAERVRARAGGGGLGAARRAARCISSTPPPATSWTWGWRMAEIGLDGVGKRFLGQQALDGLTLTIADGEFFVLLGPTGAGKTTTLRLVAGLEIPDAGRVSIGGEDTAGWSVAQRDVALVFQYYSLYPRYTVRQNLAFPLKSRVRELLRRRDREAGGAGGEDAADRAPARPQDRPALGRRDAAGVDRAGDRARPERVPDGRAACRTSTRSCARRCARS